MKKIKIIGTYITKFGELWDRSLESLFEEAVFGSLNSVLGSKFDNRTDIKKYGTVSKIPKFNEKKIEAVFVANMAGGQFANQSHLNALVSGMFKHNPPSFRVEAACASGGMALEMAGLALQSGKYKTVLVVGAEKMTDVTGSDSTKILAGASEYQKEYGSTFPALYALLAKAHIKEFGTTREQLSAVANKNHRHALSNPKAQFKKNIPKDIISKSTIISEPIRLLDCSPVSDGASAVILSTKNIKRYSTKPVIEAVGHGQDSLSLADREFLTELKATKIAARQVYEKLKIKPSDISFAEVHDCFTIAEILASEDLGFFKKGTGGKAVEFGKTTYSEQVAGSDTSKNSENNSNKGSINKNDDDDVVMNNGLIINPSGGLKACGHPVGATGIKQVAFLAKLLESESERLIEESLKSKDLSRRRKGLRINTLEKNNNHLKIKNNKIYTLAHNVGGSGATAIVHVISMMVKEISS